MSSRVSEMEADNPWEALNLDDSDLPSFIRPCNRKSLKSPPPFSALSQPLSPVLNSPPSSSPNLIPGPAGSVQAAMLRKLQNSNNSFSTQEYIRRAIVDNGSNDDDFSRNPWLFALEFILREGLADDGGTIGTPLSWIKTEPKLANRKVAQIVAVIKSCTSNGLGDLMVTLKDPTGTIDASIHRKVLVEGGYAKDITVGTVLILHKVSVFSPPRSAPYLNITLNNVFKAIPKDSEPLSEQNHTSRIISTVHGIENTKQSWDRQKVSSLSPDKNAKNMNTLTQTGYTRGRVLNDKGTGGDKALGSNCCTNGTNRSQNATSMKEPPARQDIASRMKKVAVLVGTNEPEENVMVEKPQSPQNLAGRDNHPESNQSSGGADIANEWESVSIDEDKKQRQVPISRGSLPQWTDEQLDELCSFD